MSSITVQGLATYPLKSAKAQLHRSIVVDDHGLKGDRSFMVVNKEGDGVTAREFSHLGLVELKVLFNEVLLIGPGQTPLALDYTDYRNKIVQSKVWGQAVDSFDLGDRAARWISRYLHGLDFGFRVVEKTRLTTRRLGGNAALSFSDIAPVLILSRESLNHLNRKLDFQISINNFRANIIVSGCEAHAEDGWDQIIIGDTEFRSAGPCPRCIMTTFSPTSALADLVNEPIKSLSNYRTGQDGNIYFGSYFYPVNTLSPEIEKQVNVDDPVVIRSRRETPLLKTSSSQPSCAPSWRAPVTSVVINNATPSQDQRLILRCRSVLDESRTIKSFLFDANLGVSFEEGQFGIFKLPIFGRNFQRCYSFSCSNCDPRRVKISVKREDGGVFSNYLHDFFGVGDTIEMHASFGSYTIKQAQLGLELDDTSEQDNDKQVLRPLVLFSAGSGVTPNIAIAEKYLRLESTRNIYFIYSASTQEDFAFIPLLKRCEQELENFTLYLNVTQLSNISIDRAEHQFICGRLVEQEIAIRIPDISNSTVLLCGPEGYRNTIRSICFSLGVNRKHLIEEAFKVSSAPLVAEHTYEIRCAKNNLLIDASSNVSILDSLLGAGVEVPYSCKIGVCGKCETRVLSGSTKGQQSHHSGDKPENKDKLLLCCNRPTSDIVLDL